MKNFLSWVFLIVTLSGCANLKVSEITAVNNPLLEYQTGKVLYIAVQQEYCDKIVGLVDDCRLPKFMKVTEFAEQKKQYSIRIKETAIADGSYNPTGLLIALATLPLGGGVGQGAAIGNSSPLGSMRYKNNGNVGFIINEEKIVECGVMTEWVDFNNCRQQMLAAIKSRGLK